MSFVTASKNSLEKIIYRQQVQDDTLKNINIARENLRKWQDSPAHSLEDVLKMTKEPQINL